MSPAEQPLGGVAPAGATCAYQPYPAGNYIVSIEVPEGHRLGHGELSERVRAALVAAGVPFSRIGTRFERPDASERGVAVLTSVSDLPRWCDGQPHSATATPPLPLHDVRYSGDDPYTECRRCGLIRDSLTGRVIVPGRPSSGDEVSS